MRFAYKIILLLTLSSLMLTPVFSLSSEAATGQNEQDRQNTRKELSEVKSVANLNAQATQKAVCERRQKLIDKRVYGINNLVAKQSELLGTIYSRVQTFVDENSLNVENYQQLSSEVDNAKSQAEDKIEAQKSNPPGLNCESEDHVANVQAYKSYVQSTNNALKSYRQSLRELIKAVKLATNKSGGNSQ